MKNGRLEHNMGLLSWLVVRWRSARAIHVATFQAGTTRKEGGIKERKEALIGEDRVEIVKLELR